VPDNEFVNGYTRKDDANIHRELGGIQARLSNIETRMMYDKASALRFHEKMDDIGSEMAKISGGLKVFVVLAGLIGGAMSFLVSWIRG
jgi:hypothetical protein